MEKIRLRRIDIARMKRSRKRQMLLGKTFLAVAGLLLFCYLAGKSVDNSDFEKQVRIGEYEKDDSMEKRELTFLAFGDRIYDRDEGREQRVITTEGVYAYQDPEIEKLQYQRVTAYIRDGMIVDAVGSEESGDVILKNGWVMEAKENAFLYFWNGNRFYIDNPRDGGAYERPEREQVADVTLGGGEVKRCKLKKEKRSGKLLSVTEKGIELEGEEGRLEFTEDRKVYRLYGALAQETLWQLPVGYENTDFVMEEGKVCACLILSGEGMETIRVLLQSGNYEGIYHSDVELSADCPYTMEWGEAGTQSYQADDVVKLEPESACFHDGCRVQFHLGANSGKFCLPSVQRGREEALYRGRIEVLKTEAGLVVINELLLEEYLYGVVPSEMPASYPRESLKAQAVCARTYAYRHMRSAAFPEFGAHVDDGTGYQVYGNAEEKTETTEAVKETQGQALFYEDEPIEAYYYSTSCGYGTDTRAWNGLDAESLPYLEGRRIAEPGMEEESGTEEEPEDFRAFLKEKPSDCFEYEEPWFRWEYAVEESDPQILYQRLLERYNANPGWILTKKGNDYVSQSVEKFKTIKELKITDRVGGSNAAALEITTENLVYRVLTEYNIRYVLNDGKAFVLRQDGSKSLQPLLLPSAFIAVEMTGKGYTVYGGGYGHGIGMSQNGAKAMAARGYRKEQILSFFYRGAQLKEIY